MAKYDLGGGCSCGLQKECDPTCEHFHKKPMTDNKKVETRELVRNTVAFLAANKDECGIEGDFDVLKATECAVKALSFKQPSPKDEPQRQGEESEWRLVPLTPTKEMIAAMKHCEEGVLSIKGAWAHILENSPSCRAVLDDAAVERAAKAIASLHQTGLSEEHNVLFNLNPEGYRKSARAAILAFLQQEPK